MEKEYTIKVFKKKTVIVIIVAALFFVSCLGGYFVYHAYTGASIEKAVINDWQIDLPEHRDVKYRARATHQDGHDTYLVYKIKTNFDEIK